MSIETAFFSRSLAWREGFVHCMSGAKWSECADYVDKEHLVEFEKGWESAMLLQQRHNDDLNRR